MDLAAHILLDKLLIAGEKASVGRRSREAALTESTLAEYRAQRSLQAKESFETTMQDARAQGAVELVWDKGGAGVGFIQRVNLVDAGVLAVFLGRIPLAKQLAEARSRLNPFQARFLVLEDVLQQWSQLRTVRTMGPNSVQDWLDAIRAIDFAHNEAKSDVIAQPIREVSARLFNDSKRIEKLSAPIDVLLTNSVDSEIRRPAEIWEELGLFREEHPVRLAGKVVIERGRVTACLDAPYAGFPAAAILRLGSIPRLVMTIENQTTFHSEARRHCEEDVLLIYTAGMPSPAWRAMYIRLLTGLPIEVPVYHWSDIDEGGFRIAATLAQDARKIGRVILPWKMHPDDVPAERRRKASAYTLDKIKHFAAVAGWQDLGDAIAAAGFTVEQENLA